MCGRFGRTTAAQVFAQMIEAELSERLDDAPGFNLPPGTFQQIALKHPDTSKTTLGPAWWGFTPSFKKNRKPQPINARADKLESGFYKRSFTHQRCLVCADFWIEWQKAGSRKQPFAIRPEPITPFFFAGIWAKASKLPDADPARGQVTFAIITGEPHPDIAHIHNRQPLSLTLEAAQAWLSEETEPAALHDILSAGCYDNYRSWPIDKAVGNPKNGDPALFEPAE